jgi:O-methyltransferase
MLDHVVKKYENRLDGPDQRIEDVRRLYTDLLISIITNTIYEDPSMSPWHQPKFEAANRAIGIDWPRTAHTMVGVARLRNLRDLLQAAIDEGIPGHVIETGVWRGGCCILMKGVLRANNDESRKVYVADSFAGLPPPDPTKYRDPAGDPHHTFKELIVPADEVQKNFEAYNLLDENVVFVEGFFEETLPKLDASPYALIRLDGDMYGSTIVALENLYPKLSPRGYVIIDDYGAVEGCRQAVTDYRTAKGIEAPMHQIDWTGVWWRKPA